MQTKSVAPEKVRIEDKNRYQILRTDAEMNEQIVLIYKWVFALDVKVRNNEVSDSWISQRN